MGNRLDSATAKEMGRKGGLANGKKKYAELDRIINRVLKTEITPGSKVAEILEEAGVPQGEKVQVYSGIITIIAMLALNGNLNAANMLFDLYGVTSNAREKLAKAAAVDKMAENPGATAVKDIAPVTPEQMKAEALALGIYRS